MSDAAKRLARLAMLAALGFALLYIASLLPTARLALAAIAGLCSALALMSFGPWWSAGLFAVTAALSLLLLPTKGCAILYAAFFGYYPIFKSLFERLKSRPLGWALKLLVFNAAFFALWFAARGLLLTEASPLYNMLLPLCLGGNAAFLVYDIGLSRLIGWYISRIAGRIK